MYIYSTAIPPCADYDPHRGACPFHGQPSGAIPGRYSTKFVSVERVRYICIYTLFYKGLVLNAFVTVKLGFVGHTVNVSALRPASFPGAGVL